MPNYKENASMASGYVVNINDNNVGAVLSAGKEQSGSDVDMSAMANFKNDQAKLNSLTAKQSSYPSSKLGTSEQIQTLIDSVNTLNEEIAQKASMLKIERKNWLTHAERLFTVACDANVVVVIGNAGFSIHKASGSEKPGVYPTPDNINGENTADGIDEKYAETLVELAQNARLRWSQYLSTYQKLWKHVKKSLNNEKIPTQTTIETVISDAKARLNAEYKQAKDHEKYEKDLKVLENHVAVLKKKKDELMSRINEIDPVLTSFSLPAGKSVYDADWLNAVQAASQTRVTMPYLPMSWSNNDMGCVYDWAKAIADKRPHLFLETDAQEGRSGHMDMLDNFVSTILLAFPPKQVHFTIIKNKAVLNKFIEKLPVQVCDIFDAHRDIDEIVKKLTTVYQNGKENPVESGVPREIVVIAGFGKKDSIVDSLFSRIMDIIEEGQKVGIYMAIVLSNDITQYDANEDFADFGHLFAPYSTVLSNKKDENGAIEPAYDLLRRKAKVPVENKEVDGTLGDLISAYITTGALSVPSKVYEGLVDGSMYTDKLITDLRKQSSKDANQLVVPVAETAEGEVINFRLDDSKYIFSMILGRSGMGKSFTLQTILTNIMLKYDPSTVEVMLMDFKPGGVELNYYKDVPHVSNLLVNGADKQVAGEILKSILRDVKQKGEMSRKCGVASIHDYNEYAERNGLEKMKHVILLVDECQKLFEIPHAAEIISEIASVGRSFGTHLVLATQTMKGFDIPSRAIDQFTELLFMGCQDTDVAKCGINDRDVQRSVDKLVQGEVIYVHKGSEPQRGFVYNYAGKGNVYKKKTKETLLSKRYATPDKKQFYFESQQIFKFGDAEAKAIVQKAKAGRKMVPTAALGINLNQSLDAYYSRMGKGDGNNLLVVGATNLLQGERVLWGAVQSLHHANKAIGQSAHYYILPTFPEDVEFDAQAADDARNAMLDKFEKQADITIVDEDERADTIERVAATVRGRQQLAETDRKAIDGLKAIYLVMPNQQLFSRNMQRGRPKGLASFDDFSLPAAEAKSTATDTAPSAADGLGFDDLNLSLDEPATPGFDAINFDGFDSPSASTQSIQPGKPGSDYDEELRYILEYGPAVNVHVLLQTTGPDKIYAGDTMREKEMTLLFNDIVFLRMLQASTMSLPVDNRIVEQLSDEPTSLRALVYNSERGENTIIPFDFN